VTDAEVISRLSDTAVVGLTLFGEARGEPIEGKVAVANVIRHRVAAARFGMGFRGVCLKPFQFSCWNADGSPNYESVIVAAINLRDNKPSGPALRECLWVAEGVMFDKLSDNVHGATHYLTNELFQAGTVSWARGQHPVARVAGHTFFIVA
jgi:N-acetylmuramoyl-L-alanine amidase